MTDDNALRLGGRSRREDDLRDIVARDRHGRHRPVGRPVEVSQLPDVREALWRFAVDVVADEDHARSNLAVHPLDEVDGRAIVDGNDDDAREQATPVADHPLGTVLAPEDDFVTLSEPGSGEAGCKSTGRAARVYVGILTPTVAIVEREKCSADLDEVLKEVDERVPAHL